MIYGCKGGRQGLCWDFPNCEGCADAIDIRVQANTEIKPNTDLNNVKPIGLYENSEEVLRTLEKLYNDFTMRPDECKALDWAIKFIKAHQKDGLDRMISDCERRIVCKGCPHEKECE